MSTEIAELCRDLGPKYQILLDFKNDRKADHLVFKKINGRHDILIGKDGTCDTAWVLLSGDGSWSFVSNRKYVGEKGTFKTADGKPKSRQELVRAVWGRIKTK